MFLLDYIDDSKLILSEFSLFVSNWKSIVCVKVVVVAGCGGCCCRCGGGGGCACLFDWLIGDWMINIIG